MLLGLAGCSGLARVTGSPTPTPPFADWQTVVAQPYGVTLALPGDWQAQPAAAALSYRGASGALSIEPVAPALAGDAPADRLRFYAGLYGTDRFGFRPLGSPVPFEQGGLRGLMQRFADGDAQLLLLITDGEAPFVLAVQTTDGSAPDAIIATVRSRGF